MSANIDTSNVHLGHWINYSYGTIRGSTLTLTHRDGGLLTAFVAMFVGYAGGRIWHLMCFGLYLLLSTADRPRDAIYHQRQALLRNSSSAESVFWNLSRVAWAWRRSGAPVLLRLLSLAILSFVVGVVFALAGVFSSQVSSSVGSEVLLNGKNCGLVSEIPTTTFLQRSTILNPYVARMAQVAVQRARQCYEETGTIDTCSSFVLPRLPLNMTQSSSCPFDEKICVGNVPSVILDTGLLDSQKHFGINSRDVDRISYRQVFHCAPLKLKGYSDVSRKVFDTSYNWIPAPGNQSTLHLNYGGALGQPNNFTYQYPVIEDQLDGLQNGQGRQYTLMSALAYYNNSFPEASGYEPIDELFRSDADTQLLFLSSNYISYLAEVDDPWFSAHGGGLQIVAPGQGYNNDGIPTYSADQAVGVVACASQAQWCNPTLPPDVGCTPLVGRMAIFDPTLDSSMWTTQSQAEAVGNFTTIIESGTPYPSLLIDSLGPLALKAGDTLSDDLQVALPKDQWQIEMKNLVSIVLALEQRAFVEHANGPSISGLDDFLITPKEQPSYLCTSQKVLSSDFTSFSTLGLALTFGIGGLFVLLSYIAEPLAHALQRRRHTSRGYALAEWSMNNTLHLQSALHEELGAGSWTREIGGIPTTKSGDLLATLDLSEADNPKFSKHAMPLVSSTAYEIIEDKRSSDRGAEMYRMPAPGSPAPREQRHSWRTSRPSSFLRLDSGDREGTSFVPRQQAPVQSDVFGSGSVREGVVTRESVDNQPQNL